MLRWVLLCDYCSCFCRRPLNLVGPPLPTSLSWFTSATITTGSEYVPLQTCLLPLSFRPRGRCSCLRQQTFYLPSYITRAWGMPASFVHICILFHTLWKVGSTGSSLLQRIALYGLTLALPSNTILSQRNIDEFRLYVLLLLVCSTFANSFKIYIFNDKSFWGCCKREQD